VIDDLQKSRNRTAPGNRRKEKAFIPLTARLPLGGRRKRGGSDESLKSGKSHLWFLGIMAVAVKKNYDVKLDTKRRVTIRSARTEFYHVTEYEDGTIKMEPRVLVSPDMLEQIDVAVKRHKAGHKGTKIDWSKLPEV
jgi:hypothetical protein